VKGAWSEALACLVATKETPGIATVAAATVVAVGKHREMRGKILLEMIGCLGRIVLWIWVSC